MRWMARRAWSTNRRARILTVLAVAVAYGIVLLIPVNVGAASFDHRPGLSARQLPTISGTAKPFGGVAAVGALFTVERRQTGHALLHGERRAQRPR